IAAGETGIAYAPTAGGLPSGQLARTVRNMTYHFSPQTFFQSNARLLETLIDEAVDDYAGRLAIDLYAGVGLFTLPLARRFSRVIGVESHNEAIQFARQNIAANRFANIELQHARVERWLADFVGKRTGDSEPV